jgi:hypothetical protein
LTALASHQKWKVTSGRHYGFTVTLNGSSVEHQFEMDPSTEISAEDLATLLADDLRELAEQIKTSVAPI